MRFLPMPLLCLLLLTLAVAAPVRADGPDRVAPVSDPLVRKECGECHMAFQPGLLPAGSWRRIMQTLSDHFGDRATLPPDQVALITAYLTANAGEGDPALSRITEQGWWRHEHRKRWTDWLRAEGSVKAKARSDCAACHRDAERGLYEDD
ncbi:MAG: cytochrome C [Rhodospirillaceae bacterium]